MGVGTFVLLLLKWSSVHIPTSGGYTTQYLPILGAIITAEILIEKIENSRMSKGRETTKRINSPTPSIGKYMFFEY
jgi:hypothetical protein